MSADRAVDLEVVALAVARRPALSFSLDVNVGDLDSHPVTGISREAVRALLVVRVANVAILVTVSELHDARFAALFEGAADEGAHSCV